MQYSFTNAWGASWGTLKRSWLRLSGVCVIYLIANIPVWFSSIAQVITERVGQKHSSESQTIAAATGSISGLMGCCSGVYQLLVLTPLMVGVLWIAICAVRGSRVEFGEMLRGFRRFPSVLGTVLLFIVVQMVPLILGVAVLAAVMWFGIGFDQFKDGVQWADFDDVSRAALAVGFAWMVATIVICYWISIRSMFAFSFVVDRERGNLGPLAAIEASWALTRGRALSLLGFVITVGMAGSVTVLCCILPYVVFGMPFVFVAFATAYQQLLNRDAKPSAPIVTGA